MKKISIFNVGLSRKNFWLLAIVNAVICVMLTAIDSIFGLTEVGAKPELRNSIYQLFLVIPLVGISLIEFHQTSLRAAPFLIYWLLIVCLIMPCYLFHQATQMIVILTVIGLLVFFCTPILPPHAKNNLENQ